LVNEDNAYSYSAATAAPTDAQSTRIYLSFGNYNELSKNNDTSSLSGVNVSGANESVNYVYVEPVAKLG
jgi:hypothetical protein